MLIHGKLDSSTVNGPGVRAVIWFQGCTLNCPGCHNPDTHKFDLSKDVPFSELQTWLLNLDKDVTGITFSGGEPLQHFADVYAICKFLRDVRPDLSIGMFTGYTERELITGHWITLHPSGAAALIAGDGKLWELLRPLLDWAVMGRFNARQMSTSKPLCGSRNQDVILFSDRYKPEDFQAQAVNVTIDGNGLVQITGFPGVEFIEAVQNL